MKRYQDQSFEMKHETLIKQTKRKPAISLTNCQVQTTLFKWFRGGAALQEDHKEQRLQKLQSNWDSHLHCCGAAGLVNWGLYYVDCFDISQRWISLVRIQSAIHLCTRNTH